MCASINLSNSPDQVFFVVLLFSIDFWSNCQQITGIPVVFISALEGRGRTAVLDQVIDTYEKWCSRLPTARLNRWLQKVITPSVALYATVKLAIGSELPFSSLFLVRL